MIKDSVRWVIPGGYYPVRGMYELHITSWSLQEPSMRLPETVLDREMLAKKMALCWARLQNSGRCRFMRANTSTLHHGYPTVDLPAKGIVAWPVHTMQEPGPHS